MLTRILSFSQREKGLHKGTSKNSHFVVPAQAGTHKINHIDSRLRGNDELLEVPITVPCRAQSLLRRMKTSGAMRFAY